MPNGTVPLQTFIGYLFCFDKILQPEKREDVLIDKDEEINMTEQKPCIAKASQEIVICGHERFSGKIFYIMTDYV